VKDNVNYCTYSTVQSIMIRNFTQFLWSNKLRFYRCCVIHCIMTEFVNDDQSLSILSTENNNYMISVNDDNNIASNNIVNSNIINNNVINTTSHLTTSSIVATTKEASTTAVSTLCTTPNCGKIAILSCPTCIKLGIPPSKFCNQICFKSYWDEHKILHKTIKSVRAIKDPSIMPIEFKGYYFTGLLRPYQKTSKRLVPDNIKKPDYAIHPQGIPISEQIDKRTNTTIRIYNENEINFMKNVCKIGREVLDIASAAIKVGITCDEIDRIVHEATIERGAYPSPLNYHNFPKSVCTSVNEVICHGIPDLRELQDGDIVNIDISVYKDGYHADLNETFFVGNIDDNSIRLVKCAYEALAAAINIVKPGTLYRDVGEAINLVTKAAKCSIVSYFMSYYGIYI